MEQRRSLGSGQPSGGKIPIEEPTSSEDVQLLYWSVVEQTSVCQKVQLLIPDVLDSGLDDSVLDGSQDDLETRASPDNVSEAVLKEILAVGHRSGGWAGILEQSADAGFQQCRVEALVGAELTRSRRAATAKA